MIELTFHSTDPDEMSLAQRYWAMDENGKFKENLTALLPFRDISTTNRLVNLIREIAKAHDKNQICPNCGRFEEVTIRSHVKKTSQLMRYHCNVCREEAAAKEHAAAIQAQEELITHIQIAIKHNAAMSIDYNLLADDIVLILLALNHAIAPRLLNGTFKRDDCRALAPAYVPDFIKKLYKASAIVDQPEMTNMKAYVIKDGSLCHYPNQVLYRLTPDKTLGGGEIGFSYLEQRQLQDNEAIRNLWLDYATADCMCYFFNRCELHGLNTTEEHDQEIYSQLHAALRKYSVSQLWSVTWKVVEDAAALSTREYYNKQSAAATLPGKLQRHLEKIERGQASLGQKKWERPTLQPAGTLGQLFSELYNIDESTPGSVIMNLFADPITNKRDYCIDPRPEEITESSLELMSAALGHSATSEVLLCFADAIRSGANVKEAIDEVFDTYPYLSDPY
jgi:hypothetical protein